MKPEIHQVGDNIHRDLDLGDSSFKNHTELLNAIKQRVEYLIEYEPGLLFSYLYRLDVSEKKVKDVLNNQNDGDIIAELTHLIYNRQLDRVRTKEKLKQRPIEGWEW